MLRTPLNLAVFALAALLPTTQLADVVVEVREDEVEEISDIVSKDTDIFVAEPISLSISDMRVQILTMDFGVDKANQEYVIAGSTSGIFPGTNLGTISVPLNYDSYTDLLLERLDTKTFPGFKGYLDENGRATAQVRLPDDLSPDLVGSVFFHVAIVFSKTTDLAEVASEVAELVLLP